MREFKEDSNLNRITNPADFRSRIDDIIEQIDTELGKFRNSKEAAKYKEWAPFFMKSLFPAAVTYLFGPIPGLATFGFSFAIEAVEKNMKKSEQFRYPKVLQTLCATQDLVWQKEIQKIGKH